MGHKVVSVEPFYDNFIRIHKASYLANTYNNIILITNAISNKRNEIKLLEKSSDNIGGQSLIQNKEKNFEKDDNNKYLVETILFDDIVPYLPAARGQDALLKIDIEGFEIFAFENANRLFDHLNIRVVFMEWFNLARNIGELKRVLELIEFFYRRDYKPYGEDRLLNRNEWKNWTYDIVWKKN